MRQITEFDTRPETVEVFRVGAKAYVRLRENIEKTESGFRAVEYEIETVYSDGLEERVKTAEWTETIKHKVYEATVEAVRAKRRELIEATDNYCLTDRPQPSEAMIAYRQHLRDIPEQEGFPYEIDWGVKPEV